MKSWLFSFFCLSQLAFAKEVPIPSFTPPGDPSLNRVATEVPLDEIRSEKTQAIIEQMLAIATGERTDTGKGSIVGLAAPQIGIDRQIILVDKGVTSDRKELGQLFVYINPQIIEYSPEIEEGREGCYSVDRRVVGIVPRSLSVRIAAWDREGNQVVEELSGMTARIFQHEWDHLQGIRFPERIVDRENLHWVNDEEFASYRENWSEWPHPCPWEIWLSMQEGRTYRAPSFEDVLR